ncbi:MAG: carbon-nitrogen hydrolase family protein, partial [Gemmatimonadetes bacterium]|nr:carbon-nitrogen hydrolase family protein [Gemmatimonadota bacterium]
MTTVRIALANLRSPANPEESIDLVNTAVAEASARGAEVVCFPECYVPGYRGLGTSIPPMDPVFLQRAWRSVAGAAADAGITVILGTERPADGAPTASALVIDSDGTTAGFQDKVQIDPSEDGIYQPGTERRVFRAGALVFGVVICHEGWRYPETVRWAVRNGAH